MLHYYFFEEGKPGIRILDDDSLVWQDFSGSDDDVDTVREAFAMWKDLGINLSFEEVGDRESAELRIGFLQRDGSWSYVGRDNVAPDQQAPNFRTMNFGWALAGWEYGFDTALHEIGHALGLPHEHQNPNAGIVWNEPAVIAHFRQSDGWDEETTRHNILDKIPPYTVEGSDWDHDSIMHYEFEKGLIHEPEQYRTQPLEPEAGLSARDKTWIRSFYPEPEAFRSLEPHLSQRLSTLPGQQADFLIEPSQTRVHQFQINGEADCVMVLFEEEASGQPRYRTGDDDTGSERNAYFKMRLERGRRYILRVMLHYAPAPENVSVLVW